jgi:hypothetical protein
MQAEIDADIRAVMKPVSRCAGLLYQRPHAERCAAFKAFKQVIDESGAKTVKLQIAEFRLRLNCRI